MARAVPLVRVVRETALAALTPRERYEPVRVRAGALGPGVPHTDLTVTADHGLCVGGVLVARRGRPDTVGL